MPPIKIACVTTYDLNDTSTWPVGWTGICSNTYKAAKGFEALSLSIEYVGPLARKYSLLNRAKCRLYERELRKRYFREADTTVLKSYAHQINRRIEATNPDIIWCHENALPIAYLRTKAPVVLWTDATLASLIDWYPYFTNLCAESVRQIHALEEAALKHCALAIYPSQWAAQTAIEIYNIDPAKLKIVPFGPNMESGRTRHEIELTINSRPASPCKLIFIGTHWMRKGGDVAAQVAAALNAAGIQTELTVIGCSPPVEEPIPDFLRVVGYLDRAKQHDLEKLTNLIAQSHFLILPTKADCFPSVLTEANSFGVPSLTTRVGGLESLVHNGVNGMTFPLAASVSDYCGYIAAIMNDKASYSALALSSYDEQRRRLNWTVACEDVKRLMTTLVN